MRFVLKVALVWALLFVLLIRSPAQAQTPTAQPVVRAVLFHSPVCSFCRKIVDEDLPPAIQVFGNQLQILEVDIDTPEGAALYKVALDYFGIHGGVPMIFVGNAMLNGINIPTQLPSLVNENLEQGGLEWPPIPGLDTYLQNHLATPSPTADCSDCEANIDYNLVFPTQTVVNGILQPSVQEETGLPVVHTVLFWIEGCGHCHEVLEKVLPPLQEKYGDQLQIMLVEVGGLESINHLYDIAARYGIPKDRVGVPLLIIGDHVLIGSNRIPEALPVLIETYLAQGGVPWPDISEFADLIPEENRAEEICAPITPCSDPVSTASALVEALLFTTPDCHDCQLIAAQVRNLARDTYNGQFAVETIDIVTSEDVEYLYQVAAQFGLAKDAIDLPLLILGDHILVNEEIPAQLPDLIETYLQAGGITPVPLPLSDTEMESALSDEVPSSPEGFWIAIGTLIFMAAALVYSLIRLALAALRTHQLKANPPWLVWAIPLLALVGLGVAGYLGYVETQMVSATCGPVGDCNAVQGSPYARLFGVLPIGVLGMVGYLGILLAWSWGRFRQDVLAEYAALALYGMSFVGTLFSLYLTYLEPFVIKAVCMWCISSAMIITLLLLLSLNPMLRQLTWDKENDINTTLET